MDPEESQSTVEAVIRQTLSLPRSEQRRVAEILTTIVAPGVPPAPYPTETAITEPEFSSVRQWLDSLSALAPWERLRLVDDALEHADSSDDIEILQRARQQLLDNHPPLSVRASVTRLIETHPGMSILGIAGLGFGVFALGRCLFRLIF